jgi:hypothetical protein
MRWAWNGTLATIAGSANIQSFNLNGLYDPDLSGTGNQPRYFDTLIGASGGLKPYTYFRVRRTHFRVGVFNMNSTATTATYAYCQVYNNAALSTTSGIDAYFEVPNTATVCLAPNANENSMQWIEGSVDMSKFVGSKDFEDDEDLAGSYVANPSNTVKLDVGVRAMDDTTVGTLRIIAQFVYEVELFGLNDAGSS